VSRKKIIQLLKFLNPTESKVLLFAVFLFILWAGGIQSYVFTNGETYGLPKPMFYDLLKPFPFWATLMYLLLPLIIPGSLIGVKNLPEYLLIPAEIVYFYILACLIVSIGFYCYRKLQPRFKTLTTKSKIILIILVLLMVLASHIIGITLPILIITFLYIFLLCTWRFLAKMYLFIRQLTQPQKMK